MKHFQPNEFGGWYEQLHPQLKEKLDAFREGWGAPVQVSPVGGAVGRRGGSSRSRHNVDVWGNVQAVDVFPIGLVGHADAIRAVSVAKRVGFTGIGFYPNWRPQPGVHLDVRDDRPPGRPATWGGIRPDGGAMKYVSLQEAIDAL